MNQQYNVLIDVVGALLVGAILIAEYRNHRGGRQEEDRLLHRLMQCCLLVFLSDIPGLLLDGAGFPGARPLLWTVDTAYWLLQIVYCWLWLRFAVCWAFERQSGQRGIQLLCALPLLAEAALILTTPVTGWVFVLNGENLYARGSLYLPNMLAYALYIAAALGVSFSGYLRSDQAVGRGKCISLMVYMLLPICGVIFDAFVYGISWVWPMVALSLLMVYLNVHQRRLAEGELMVAQRDTQLQKANTAIMLSQIQPHFLYNTLNAIKHLCTGNDKAQEIVTDFARYLRGNMDSLTHREPIPFTQELEHLQCYLNIEAIRFPDVEVCFDLQVTDFLLPALSVQPLVENAICHGVTCRTHGGTVRISSFEAQGGFCVRVEDDGVGFDPAAVLGDGADHVGIQNVRSRLAALCGGTLEVDSTPGEGTCATIFIPKEVCS